LALAVLVIALVIVFSNVQSLLPATNLPGTEAAELQTLEPYPGPMATPTAIRPETPQVEATFAVTPPTPFPDNGKGVTKPAQLIIPAEILQLYAVDLDDANSVGLAQLDEGTAVVLINLESGQSKYISQVSPIGPILPQISGNDVVWVERAAEGELHAIQVHNLANNQTYSPLEILHYTTFELDEGIIIFSEYRNDEWGLYAYALSAAQETRVASGPIGCSRISYPWITYLEHSFGENGQPADTAELRAFNIESTETLTLGTVFAPNESTPCSFYAVGHDYVTWMTVNPDPATASQAYPALNETVPIEAVQLVLELRAYDLHQRVERVVDMPTQERSPMLLSGNVLIVGSVGFDLTNNLPFNIAVGDEGGEDLGPPVLFSNSRLVWMPIAGTHQSFYTASIKRGRFGLSGANSEFLAR
jgi:hypothetical protein